jgi:hypothetical protein
MGLKAALIALFLFLGALLVLRRIGIFGSSSGEDSG